MTVTVLEREVSTVETVAPTVTVTTPSIQTVTTVQETATVVETAIETVETEPATVTVETASIATVETASATVTVVEPSIQTVETPAATVTVIEYVRETVEVEVGVPNPTLIFKTVDETNTTTSFTNDDELRFAIVLGHRYTVRLTLLTFTDWVTAIGMVRFDGPAGDTMTLNALGSGFGGGDNEVLVDGFAVLGYDLNFADPLDPSSSTFHVLTGVIDASANGGEVAFQWKLDDGGAGTATVFAGSMIEVFDLGVQPV